MMNNKPPPGKNFMNVLYPAQNTGFGRFVNKPTFAGNLGGTVLL